MDSGPEPRFLVDAMLGKLARWLILLGYDARYDTQGRADLELLEQARREDRIFLTRDARIPEVKGLVKLVLRETALALVPPLVRELQTDFFRCPSCGRLYWNGTHAERTMKKLRRLGLYRAGEKR